MLATRKYKNVQKVKKPFKNAFFQNNKNFKKFFYSYA